MAPTVVVIATGEMGSGVGWRLASRGARVLTSLAGRSDASRARASRAGMIAVEDDARLAAEADFVLSIVPPGEALAFARRMAPPLSASNRKPLFVDCNAVSPATVGEIATAIAPTGCGFVDAGIIGAPPREGYDGTRFYASGPRAAEFANLRDYGLDIRLLDDKIGTASAQKLAYASLTKGLTTLGAVMMLGAERAGIAEPLRRELGESQPALLQWLDRQMPSMYGKAYRWVAEMEEIADYLEGDGAGVEIFQAAAAFYRRIAAGIDGPEVAALKRFTAEKK